MENAGSFIAEEMVACLHQLPMPPDYAITEYRSLLHLRFNNIDSQPY